MIPSLYQFYSKRIKDNFLGMTSRVSYRIFKFGGGRCCVCNRLSDENLTHLMTNATQGPDLNEVNFNEILDIFKEKNRRIAL